VIIEPEILDHPKFIAFKETLGREDALEYLVRLWGHTQQVKGSENWGRVSVQYVETVAQWPRKRGAGKLWKALLNPWLPLDQERAILPSGVDQGEMLDTSGWVKVTSGGDVVICGWDDHNQALIAARSRGKLGGITKSLNDKLSLLAGLKTGSGSAVAGQVNGVESGSKQGREGKEGNGSTGGEGGDSPSSLALGGGLSLPSSFVDSSLEVLEKLRETTNGGPLFEQRALEWLRGMGVPGWFMAKKGEFLKNKGGVGLVLGWWREKLGKSKSPEVRRSREEILARIDEIEARLSGVRLEEGEAASLNTELKELKRMLE
jgi:hypothetical protein